jgi:phage shock protein A
VVAGLAYSLRVLVDAIATSQRDRAKLEAEVLALRRQVQVLERQIERVKALIRCMTPQASPSTCTTWWPMRGIVEE